jgi:hypothetical protein
VRVLMRRPDRVGGPLPRTWLALAGILGAVVAYLAHGLFDYMLAFNSTGGLWWAALGLCLAAVPALAAEDGT